MWALLCSEDDPPGGSCAVSGSVLPISVSDIGRRSDNGDTLLKAPPFEELGLDVLSL